MSTFTPTEWYDLARKALAEEKWNAGAEMLTKILQDEKQILSEESHARNNVPSRIDLLLERGQTYLKTGEDGDKCIADAREALFLDPKRARAFSLLGAAYIQMRKYGHAEVEVKKGLKIDAKNKQLIRLLQQLTQDEDRFPSVRSRDGSDRKYREFQGNVGVQMNPTYFPAIVQAIMAGQVEDVKRLWRPEHHNLCITELKNPPISWPVLGRQRMPLWRGKQPPVEDYCEIIDFLFDHGARLDHVDKCGYTAAMHAAGHHGEPELLEHLLKKGADPNNQDIFGGYALIAAVMAQNEDTIDILLRYGADPNLKDNDNTTALKTARPLKRLFAVFDKHLNKEKVERTCMNCNTRAGNSRCVGCRYVFYCSKECQLAQWTAHKKQCKKIKKSHMRLKVKPIEVPMANITGLHESVLGNLMAAGGCSKKKPAPVQLKKTEPKKFEEFEKSWKKGGNILKLQITKDNPDEDDMMVYNKDRDLCFMAGAKELNGPDVIKLIKEKGIKGWQMLKENGMPGLKESHGLKGYFLCFIDKPGEVVIITDPMLPAQAW